MWGIWNFNSKDLRFNSCPLLKLSMAADLKINNEKERLVLFLE